MATSRMEEAFSLIDAENRQDPNSSLQDDKSFPKEYLYGLRMTDCLNLHFPKASEALKLAVRGQHIRRWDIPRAQYPTGKVGYFQWRNELKRHHSECTAEILTRVGYDEETIQRAREIISKKNLMRDRESQTLEDVACLVFLKDYFLDFASGHEEEKIVSIVQKTWKKMSPEAQEIALSLDLEENAARLVKMALS